VLNSRRASRSLITTTGAVLSSVLRARPATISPPMVGKNVSVTTDELSTSDPLSPDRATTSEIVWNAVLATASKCRCQSFNSLN
jgi:hypothetical protein